uniref:Putative secreted protein n=1 Tax=Ixodes ricinus TaxID=34613 RepID=A0A6B0UX16_IXORI
MPVVGLVSVSVCCLLSFQEPLCRGFFAENVLRGLLAFFTGDLARCCGSCGMQENFTNENLASGRVNPRLVGWGIRLQRPILVGVTARPSNRRGCATSAAIPRCCASETELGLNSIHGVVRANPDVSTRAAAGLVTLGERTGEPNLRLKTPLYDTSVGL